MPDALRVGDAAPEFELMNQDKTVVKLSDYRGKKKVVLLFYQMDFSPVCTQEHCTFGPQLPNIQGTEDAVVFGVSCDSPYCHKAFREQYRIPYDLLSDPTRKMAKAYGMWAGEEPYNCTRRGTVIIDKNGVISYYREQPAKEPRTVEDLGRAVALEVAAQQRSTEFGQAV